MTGFGSSACKDEHCSVSVELKTVNNRYFKLSLKLPDGYNAFEQRIESLLRNAIERGTVNAQIRIAADQECARYQINTAVLQSYIKQLSDVVKTLGQTSSIPMLERLLTLPGVITASNDHHEADNEEFLETTWALLEQSIRESLNALQTMRKTEGESMKKDLAANVESLCQLIGNITELAVRVPSLYQQKLKERIEKALTEQGLPLSDALHDTDFVRELAIYADRCDISEELVRFQSHLEQFTLTMQSMESCGRKLDFLTQELFREVNTIGSKANDAEITKHVVEIKTVIERIREMVQNVE